MALQPCKNYIGGNWCEGQGVIANHSPSDVQDLIGHYHQASSEQTLDAIAAARDAQPQWAASGLEQRQQVLMAIGNELMARKEELGELLSREEGKPLAEGIGEVNRSAQFFHYYAAEVLRQMGEKRLVHDPSRGRASLDRLTEPHEQALLATMSRFPEVIESAAQQRAPHGLVHYLRELATDFHAYYNAHQFLVSDDALRDARVVLILGARQVIANGLGLLGVSAPETM